MFSIAAVFSSHGWAIDESPLPIEVVPAFPQLQWPDELTGADAGLSKAVRPLWVGGSGDGSGRIYIACQLGTIHVLGKGSDGSDRRLFADFSDKIAFQENQDEEGFLGVAFHPKFAENRQFVVNYTASREHDSRRRSIISRLTAPEEAGQLVDVAKEEVLLDVHQPFWNHNGGTVVFGPDGFLYIALGDGGAGDDPHMNGQNLRSLLGKILRIDVDRRNGDRPYAIPQDNPFAGQPRYARGEVWAYGLRNVWRISFDRKTGAAWAGDVGQDTWEEIDLIVRGGNYGWNLREGKHPFGPFGWQPAAQLIEPIWDYHHDVGKSVTGGCVYRGPGVPELDGYYLYADYVSGKIWGLLYDFAKKEVVAHRQLLATGGPVTSFGEGDDGEVYFTTREGGVFKFASPPKAAALRPSSSDSR